jgi:hypothetical protein
MRKIYLILLFLGCVGYAQTGIGTTTPVNKFQVEATTADPASSGVSANGNFRLSGVGATHVLDFGLSSSSTYSWLQARSKSAYGTFYNLALNPNGGLVGVGTNAPSATLTVGNTTGSISGELTLNPAYTSNEGGQINIKKSVNGSTADWVIDQYGTSASDARFRIFNSIAEANGLSILENGNIGMGLTNPTVRLQVNGDIIANSIAGSSDARFKTNIAPIQNPLQKVMQLRGVNFDWNTKAFPDRKFSDQKAIGFIAQDVEKVLPEVVQTEKTSEGYKAVQYDKVVALLVEAIKEQQKQIDRLKLELKKKKNKR